MQTSPSQQHSSSCDNKINDYFQQESEIPPPPYKSELNDECLPQYMESMDLESMLDRFAPRWDNQRVHRRFCNSDQKGSTTINTTDTDQTGQLMDRMEEYRHTDQEWMSLNQTRMTQVIQNMYHMRHTSTVHPEKRQPTYLSSAKSTYQKMILSIAKEREQFIQHIKKIRSSPKPTTSCSSSCADEFHFFLTYICDITSQSQMSNQRATIMIPTI